MYYAVMWLLYGVSLLGAGSLLRLWFVLRGRSANARSAADAARSRAVAEASLRGRRAAEQQQGPSDDDAAAVGGVGTRRDWPRATLVVLGSGGHTGEMVSILRALPLERYSPRAYAVADTDVTSEARVKVAKVVAQDAVMHRIPRSREVGQSLLSSVPSTLRAFFACVKLVYRLRPGLVLTNGPGTCVPVCLAAFLLRFLGILDVRIVFVESVCRVRTLSLSGRILYLFADQVQVQWPQLAQRYTRAVYVGILS